VPATLGLFYSSAGSMRRSACRPRPPLRRPGRRLYAQRDRARTPLQPRWWSPKREAAQPRGHRGRRRGGASGNRGGWQRGDGALQISKIADGHGAIDLAAGYGIGCFKPLCDFDWAWPKKCDKPAIEALMSLEFLNDATNAILVGPNGIGKSTLAQKIAHQAVIHVTPCCLRP
jgi:hypothetical protein